MQVINTETGQILRTFDDGTTREGALEVMAREAEFPSVQVMERCYGGFDHLIFIDSNGIEVEDR